MTITEIREALGDLRSRNFWADFRDYWSPDAVAARMDLWVERVRGER